MKETIKGRVTDISREVDECLENGKYERIVFTKLKITSSDPKAMLFREVTYIGEIDFDVLGKYVEIIQEKRRSRISQKLIVYENKFTKPRECEKRDYRIKLPID